MNLEPDAHRSLRERAIEAIKVKAGEAYLVTPDEPLLLCRFKDREGHIDEIWIQVRHTEPKDLPTWSRVSDDMDEEEAFEGNGDILNHPSKPVEKEVHP